MNESSTDESTGSCSVNTKLGIEICCVFYIVLNNNNLINTRMYYKMKTRVRLLILVYMELRRYG